MGSGIFPRAKRGGGGGAVAIIPFFPSPPPSEISMHERNTQVAAAGIFGP